MSWIHDKWEDEHVAEAETNIKASVSSHSQICLDVFSVISVKMLKYRERITAGNNVEGQAQTPGAGAADLAGKMEKYMSLAARYDCKDMRVGKSRGKGQTIEQEYQSYITAPLSEDTVHILNFWEASDFVNGISILLTGHRRLTKQLSPLFSRWRWTICQSKHLPSLVNVSFPRALRRIPRKGTELAPS